MYNKYLVHYEKGLTGPVRIIPVVENLNEMYDGDKLVCPICDGTGEVNGVPCPMCNTEDWDEEVYDD